MVHLYYFQPRTFIFIPEPRAATPTPMFENKTPALNSEKKTLFYSKSFCGGCACTDYKYFRQVDYFACRTTRSSQTVYKSIKKTIHLIIVYKHILEVCNLSLQFGHIILLCIHLVLYSIIAMAYHICNHTFVTALLALFQNLSDRWRLRYWDSAFSFILRSNSWNLNVTMQTLLDWNTLCKKWQQII